MIYLNVCCLKEFHSSLVLTWQLFITKFTSTCKQSLDFEQIPSDSFPVQRPSIPNYRNGQKDDALGTGDAAGGVRRHFCGRLLRRGEEGEQVLEGSRGGGRWALFRSRQVSVSPRRRRGRSVVN